MNDKCWHALQGLERICSAHLDGVMERDLARKLLSKSWAWLCEDQLQILALGVIGARNYQYSTESQEFLPILRQRRYRGVQKWSRIGFYYLRDIYRNFFTGLGRLGNIYRNSGISTESERWQPALRGTPRITGLAPARIITVENYRTGPFSE